MILTAYVPELSSSFFTLTVGSPHIAKVKHLVFLGVVSEKPLLLTQLPILASPSYVLSSPELRPMGGPLVPSHSMQGY